LYLVYQHEHAIAKNVKKETNLAAAFPGLVFDEVTLEDREDIEEYIYLWESNTDIFDIYTIVKNYLHEYYVIDSLLLIELIKEKGLKVSDSLNSISYIHSSYVNVISENTDNGSEQSSSDD
jgi:hypothetical protein